MPTKREYLVAKGLAKPGHGRFSVAAKEAIKIAINSGTKFDYPGNEGTGVDATPEPRWDRPQGYYTFKNPDGTTFKRKHTEACVGCSYSFQWCQCADSRPMGVQWCLGECRVARLPKGCYHYQRRARQATPAGHPPRQGTTEKELKWESARYRDPRVRSRTLSWTLFQLCARNPQHGSRRGRPDLASERRPAQAG
jgi:hypothetical protein